MRTRKRHLWGDLSNDITRPELAAGAYFAVGDGRRAERRRIVLARAATEAQRVHAGPSEPDVQCRWDPVTRPVAPRIPRRHRTTWVPARDVDARQVREQRVGAEAVVDPPRSGR